MSEYVSYEVHGSIGVITLNNPPVNALDPQTLAELESAVDAFIAEPSGRVAIIRATPKSPMGRWNRR